MSDSFQLLLDHEASPDEAGEIGQAIIGVLVSEGIILPGLRSECVLTGAGYPPGPRLREIYTYGGKEEPPYWERLHTIGVKLHTDRYVNFFGFPVFEHSCCPYCHACFPGDHSVMDAIYAVAADFINEGGLNSITCPSCSTNVRCDRWITVPDVGLCHLAVEFWNWPSFVAGGWTLSIPDLLRARTGRRLAYSWGRL